MHNSIDLKRRTKATYNKMMQGTGQNCLHELTACILAAILQNLESSSSKSTFDYVWQFHAANPTPIEGFHFLRVLFSAKCRSQPQKLTSNTGKVWCH